MRFPSQCVTLKDGREALIRPLAAKDGEALGDFYEAVPPEDFQFYCPHALTRAKAREKAESAMAPRQVVLVLEAGDRIIGGYAWYRWQSDDAPTSVFGICLRRDFQGTGAGRAIMARLLQIAREVGPPVMSLTVQKTNVRGIELYKQMGFEIIREQIRPAKPEFGLEPEPEYYMELRVR